jgi:hypothetical protein
MNITRTTAAGSLRGQHAIGLGASMAGLLAGRALADHYGLVTLLECDSFPAARQARKGVPQGPAIPYRFPGSQWRRYEWLEGFRSGLLAIRDAVCTLNPVDGQGMTVAALEAEALHGCLTRGTHRLAPRFFSRASTIVDVAWALATGNDLRFPEAVGERGLVVGFTTW